MISWKCAFLFLFSSSLQLHLISMEAMTYITDFFYCHKYSWQTYFQTQVSGHQKQKRQIPIFQAFSCFLEDSQYSCKSNWFFFNGLYILLEFSRLSFCIFTFEWKFCSVRTDHYIRVVTFDANMVPVPLHILVSLNYCTKVVVITFNG